MHVGRRVARLRVAHGESLREAAVRTGVSHTTIARIEKGEVTGSFHRTLRKIADGYGVQLQYLLTGRDPRQAFEQALRRLSPEERSRLYFLPTKGRIELVLEFLAMEYPHQLPIEEMAGSVGPDEITQQLADVLSRLTGISPHWFRSAATGAERLEALPGETVSAYLRLINKAARAGVQPHILEMAVDVLLVSRNRIRSPSGKQAGSP